MIFDKSRLAELRVVRGNVLDQVREVLTPSVGQAS